MRHPAHVAHHSRGRLRIRVPSAKGDPAALESIRQSLASVKGVQTVDVNESIGSVTVNYDPAVHPDFHEHLANEESAQRAVSLSPPPRLQDMEDLDEMFENEAAFLAERSHSAKLLFDWMNGLDRGIKSMTGNAVDLKVIAPLALAVGAFMELGITAATPVWLTLGLFSFNHFVDLHSHNKPASPEAPAAEETTAEPLPAPAPRKLKTRAAG
jgi:hypothetical protein